MRGELKGFPRGAKVSREVSTTTIQNGQSGKYITLLKHRKNCECCPGHSSVSVFVSVSVSQKSFKSLSKVSKFSQKSLKSLSKVSQKSLRSLSKVSKKFLKGLSKVSQKPLKSLSKVSQKSLKSAKSLSKGRR